MREFGAAALALSLCGSPLRAAADDAPIKPSMAVGRTHDCLSYFPDETRRLFETGNILVGFDVGLDGAISNVHVIESSGFAPLDDAAVSCVREHWRNTPATLNGAPVASPGHRALIRFAVADPVTADDFYARGVVVGGRGDYKQALSDLTQAIAMAPRAANAYRARALVYDALGQSDLAKADRARADELSQ